MLAPADRGEHRQKVGRSVASGVGEIPNIEALECSVLHLFLTSMMYDSSRRRANQKFDIDPRPGKDVFMGPGPVCGP